MRGFSEMFAEQPAHSKYTINYIHYCNLKKIFRFSKGVRNIFSTNYPLK